MANSSFDYTLLHKPLEFVFPIILQEELEWEGVWDFNRLSLPYVRCHILQQKFGDRWQEIASKYFYEYEHLCYQFKEEYNTEKKILAAIKPSEGSPDWVVRESEEIKAELFDLLHVSFHAKEIACFSSFLAYYQSQRVKHVDDKLSGF
jgi:hypothetical protein